MKTNVHIFDHYAGETERVTDLIDTIQSTKIKPNGCFDRMTYRMTGPCESCALNVPSTVFAKSSLNISITHDGIAPFRPRFKCACGAQTNQPGQYKICAKNLAAGKCADEFMRCTVGAHLYPELYGTKQNGGR